MPTQSLILNVPEPLYQNLKRSAQEARRSVEEETLEVLASALPANNGLSRELTEALEALKVLDDASLWAAGRSRLPVEVSAELEALHQKRQREGLTEAEEQTLAALVRQYERLILVRAQAAALLSQRGHGVSGLIQP